jgi:ABC-2 type transport system permease protein
VRDIQQLPYPFFAHIARERMSDNLITSQLAAAVLHYSSPVSAKPGGAATDAKGKKTADAPARKVEVLMTSSDDSWAQKAPQVQPDFRLYPNTGFGRPQKVADADKGPHPLAVAVTGSFDSLYAGKKPDAKKADDNKGEEKGEEDKDSDERLIERSPPDARVVVVGSSSFVTDELLQLSQQAGADYVANNLELVQNMVDWAVADTDLLSIRSRGSHTRLLEVDADSRGKWETINYAIVILGLGIVVMMGVLRRRTLVPIELDRRGDKPGPAGAGQEGSEKDEEERS